MATLLPFHKSILEDIHDPSTSELLILARGLGLRRIVCKLLQIYDSPQSLVLLVNTPPEEESAIGEELGMMGCRKPGLRVITADTTATHRNDLYKKGGILSITTQICTVDMLNSVLPTHLITGIIMLHADRVSHTTSFIVQLYREKNKKGFLKAFSDQPEHITSGLSPLRSIMKDLQLRKVYIYPRFHEEIKQSLDLKRPDVVELYQNMTEYMSEIHTAIVQCMSTTLSDLKRSNTGLDLDDLNVDNAYFRSFDVIVRRQLDSVWHKVGPRTKQLVGDLATLRRLLNYLLTYDAVAFNAYIDTLIETNTTNDYGNSRQNQSPWMLTDAANTIIQFAKRRCYTLSSFAGPANVPSEVIDVDDEDEWAALDEAEGWKRNKRNPENSAKSQKTKRRWWMPKGMEPVLEELPKWSLLADVLHEVEEEMIRLESRMPSVSPGTNTVLIMTSSLRTSTVVSEFLANIDADAPPGSRGSRMMERKLQAYLFWKSKLGERKQEGKGHFVMPEARQRPEDRDVSEALKKKDKERAERSAARRRLRGGAPSGSSSRAPTPAIAQDATTGVKETINEAQLIAEFLYSQPINLVDIEPKLDSLESDFDEHYGLLAPEQTVLVRAYSDDTDDQMLNDIQPRFIIMFEPHLDFIRRIEVYRNSHSGLGIRVYFMMYRLSCEEHKYLAGLRREKDAFERLIKERGSMLMPILEERRPGGSDDTLIKTISSRIAGGRKEINTEPSRVIVDMREFRSSLPALLYASQLEVKPVTLTVGDYILTPDICVERKSIPDLVSSFNSGRLYTQCELMSTHYKQPILLIEFEENKSFSLETVADIKSYAKPSGKYPAKKKGGQLEAPTLSSSSVQAKLVLLTLTFPRVRIIWSSSPYATADIFRDLKQNNAEPDPNKAIVVGAEEDPEVGAGVNTAAEELLRTFPGITAKNVKHVTSKVGSVKQLCELGLSEVQGILGVEPGKACWEFLHRGERGK